MLAAQALYAWEFWLGREINGKAELIKEILERIDK
jgi:hypothetical protein